MILFITLNVKKVKEHQHGIVYYVKCPEGIGASTWYCLLCSMPRK